MLMKKEIDTIFETYHDNILEISSKHGLSSHNNGFSFFSNLDMDFYFWKNVQFLAFRSKILNFQYFKCSVFGFTLYVILCINLYWLICKCSHNNSFVWGKNNDFEHKSHVFYK